MHRYPNKVQQNMSEAKKRRRKRRWALLRFAFLTLFVCVAAVAFYYVTADINTRDRNLIAAKRTTHHALFRLEKPLAGTPDLGDLQTRLDAHGVSLGTPIYMRIFKREFELELWMLRDGRFHRFATYPICMWSGTLGPKYQEGDRQSPEGFYTVSKRQLNPNSRWHRSFNLGYPNLYDRSHSRTGSFLMVHGGCGSVGCYAMTDPVITELWSIVTAAFDGGQKRFHVHIFPFRMSEEALKVRHDHQQSAFWHMLKDGHDQFEKNWLPPRVTVCDGRYEFSQPETGNGSDVIERACASEEQQAAVHGAGTQR